MDLHQVSKGSIVEAHAQFSAFLSYQKSRLLLLDYDDDDVLIFIKYIS